MIVLAVLLCVATVLSLPASQNEALVGPALEVQEVDAFNPQDPQAFLKWRQIKKLLFLG
ncbi:AGAP012530-PA [Anopheles gambiae str. PEST]|nr:AGAP012530-PA [Anopheles gambiae str. PEST]